MKRIGLMMAFFTGVLTNYSLHAAVAGGGEAVGVVDSFDRGAGVIRVKDDSGAISSFKIATDTKVFEQGNEESTAKIDSGDIVIIQVKSGTENELSKIKIQEE